MWRGACLVVAAALIAAPAAAGAQSVAGGALLVCRPESALWCAAGGCGPAAGPSALIIDFAGRTLARCAGDGCDATPYSDAAAGGFVRYSVNGGAAVLTVSNPADRFTDAAFVGVGVVLSFGTCFPAISR
jgi:hypothetical protein